MVLVYALIVSLLVSVTAAKPRFTVWATPSQPLSPSNDSFYINKPTDLSSYTPGDLIRIRKAPGNLTAIFNASSAYHVVYRTEDSLGHPLWAFTTILAPLRPFRSNNSDARSSGKGIALLSFQLPYNAIDVDYSVSRLMYDSSWSANLIEVTTGLARGWFVTVPDFEGPDAAAVTGSLEGKVVLDGVRAVYALAKAGNIQQLGSLSLDAEAAKFTLSGYSGGSVASGFAGEIQTFYAPELLSRFAGVAMGGTPIDLLALSYHVDGGGAAGIVAFLLLGITQQFSASREYLISRLKPDKKDIFLSALNMSTQQIVTTFRNQTVVKDYFTNGRADLDVPLITSVFVAHANMYGKGIPAVPVFLYHAIHDQNAAIAEVDQLFESYCNGGANVWYERNTVGIHDDEFLHGHSRALAFMGSLFEGTYEHMYNPEKCIVKNVTVMA